MIYDNPKKNYSWLKYIFLLPAIFISLNFSELELRYKNSKVKTVSEPTQFTINELQIKKGETDASMHSRLVQSLFRQKPHSSGLSPDEISVRFDSPVEIHGLLISVDCWKSTRLVEFAAGINQTPAYSSPKDKDMLMHVSFATNTEAGKIDESVFFPKPFLMTPTDRLNIGAWIQNVSSDEQSVSPEIIIYYTWKIEPVAETTWRKK